MDIYIYRYIDCMVYYMDACVRFGLPGANPLVLNEPCRHGPAGKVTCTEVSCSMQSGEATGIRVQGLNHQA